MAKLSTLLLYVLTTHITSTWAGQCFSCCCQNSDSEDCEMTPLGAPTVRPPAPSMWVGCNNRPLDGQTWACEDPNLDFPTVECLVEDMRTCGVVGNNGASTVFYSFGVGTPETRPNVRDKLTPKGVMFNDGLLSDGDWYTKVAENRRFNIADPTVMSDPTKNSFNMKRQNIFVARYSEALARASAGEVFIVYRDRVGLGGKDGDLDGAYQLDIPADPNSGNPEQKNPLPNAWRTYEFGTLQRNSAVTKITGVETNNNYAKTTDWEPNKGLKVMPPSIAMELVLPGGPAPGCNAKMKRDDSACATACVPTTALFSNSTAALPSTTALFSNSTTALFSNSTTALFFSSTTALPSTTALFSNSTIAMPSTTAVPITTTVPSTTASAAVVTAAAMVQAGSSGVHVGTLTGTALYTSISSALERICPPVTQTSSATSCETDSVIIDGIDYVEAESLSRGELVVQVKSSSYNVTSLRDAMIKSAALTAQNSAGGKNCHSVKYELIGLRKRWWEPTIIASTRRWLSMDAPGNRHLEGRDHIHPIMQTATHCNAVGFAGVQYFSPFWRDAAEPGSTDYIDAEWNFQVGPGGDFVCDIIQDLLDGLALIAPEFAVEDVELGSAIEAICQKVMDHA